MSWWRRTLVSGAVVVPLALMLAACDDGPAENAGEAIDETAEEAGEAAEEAGERVEEATD
ncbi:MAG TPA: hypothetical protein VLE23_03490 [Geminicoccaceae bacterium]|nr:hypothetical protein [Geminicoccaceae bacterium]